MKYAILIYLFFNVMAFAVGVEMRQSQEFFFHLSSMLLILASIILPKPHRILSKWELPKHEMKFNYSLYTFFAWFIVVFLMNNMGWMVLINFFLGLGVYLTVIKNLEYNDVVFISKKCIWLLAFAIGYIVLQFLGIDLRNQTLIGSYGGVPKCSVFGLEAHYGLYLAAMFPLMFGISRLNYREITMKNGLQWAVVAILAILGMFICLYPSNSTGAYLGLIVAVLFYLWHKKRIIFWVAFIPVIVAGLLYITLYDNPMGMQKSRIGMWIKVIQDSHTKPFGRGLDSFRLDEREGAIKYFKYSFNDTTVRVKKVSDQWIMQTNGVPKEFEQKVTDKKSPLDMWDNPHNEYIQLLYETGFPGLIIFCVMVYFLIQVFRLSMRRPMATALGASLLSIAVFSLVQFPFHVARIGHLIPVILGMFIVSARDE